MDVKKILFVVGPFIFTFTHFSESAPSVWSELESFLENSSSSFRNRFGSLVVGTNSGSFSSEHSDKFLRPFDHQVAGHKYSYFGEADERIGILKQSEEYLLKPVIHPVYGPREIDFYEILRTTRDPEFLELKEYVPRYNGTKIVQLHDKNITFIRIEDITRYFKLPCIMDLKIGRQTWEPNAPVGKIFEQTFISPATKSLWGFSINGLKYYDISDRMFVIHDSVYYSRRLFCDETIDELYNFVNGEFGIEYGLLSGILKQLEKIRSWFQRQKQLTFFGSSILFAYDAESLLSRKPQTREDTRSIDEHNTTVIQIRMIDFAHTLPNRNHQVDMNYLNSLENLIYIFENLTTLYANKYAMISRIVHGFSFTEIFTRIFGV